VRYRLVVEGSWLPFLFLCRHITAVPNGYLVGAARGATQNGVDSEVGVE
jgi:hypothetical protein